MVNFVVEENDINDINITDSPIDPYEGMSDNEKNRMIYENKFNLIIINVFDHITKFYKNTEVNNSKEQMDDVLMQSPDGPICCFLKYVYLNDTYRKNLFEMNEEFFLDSGRIEENQEVAKDKEIIDKIFSFKKIWKSFGMRTKLFIMKAMRGLIKISTRYIKFME
jgi:hypothetical protein